MLYKGQRQGQRPLTTKVVGGTVDRMSALALQIVRDPAAAAVLLDSKRQALLHLLQSNPNRQGNLSERIVRACASQYLISPEALGKLGLDSATQRDRFSSAFLISAAARIIRDIGILSLLAAKARKRLSTLTIETEIRFADELTNFVAAQAAKYHDEKSAGGSAFRLTIAAYPQITKEHPATNDSVNIEDYEHVA